MAQHDMNVADGSGAVVRSDLNGALEAMATCQMGASAPSPTWPLMWWGDTANSLLKQRNAANTAWINRCDLSTAFLQAGDVGVAAGNLMQIDQSETTTDSATTTTLGTTLKHEITGTTTITAFNGVAGVTYHCRAGGAFTITHHATNLDILQTGANITTAADDTFDVYMRTSSTCEIINYQRASGEALVASSASVFSERFTSAAQTITPGGALVIAHGLSSIPVLVFAYLICTTAEAGYSIGDKLLVQVSATDYGSGTGLSIVPDSSNLNIRFGAQNPPFGILNKSSGTLNGATVSSWKIYFEAFS
ncbi:hypothetical protein [Paremcibacter congregatus]|uniref:hypothetical protein n=1 Tax=Paremcibacter congregatus TaxID=2043170 RepID=UPI003A90F584